MKSKSDISADVAERLSISKEEAKRVVHLTMEAIANALVAGDDVRIAGLGKFSVKATKPRTRRNPATGGTVDVPAGRKVAFKVASDLKSRL